MDLEERRSQIVNRKSLWPPWAVVAVASVGRAAVTSVGQKRKCTAALMDRTTVVTSVGQNRKWNTALLASIGAVTPLDLDHTKTENATSIHMYTN